MRTLILASNSPRRVELLGLFDMPFIVQPADVDETEWPDEDPLHFVQRLARQKAMTIAGAGQGMVIAADTIVVDGDALLGKPVDPADARRMLLQLRGRTHQVYTGIALYDTGAGRSHESVCRTDVPMRQYSDAEIDAYIATGDPLDKAGAYAIQNDAFHPVEDLKGCFASVMGLPLCHLMLGLRERCQDVPDDIPERCQRFLNFACPVFRSILGLV